MKIRKLPALLLTAAMVLTMAATVMAEQAPEGESDSGSAEMAIDTDTIWDHRCFINGDEIRAYNIDGYIYIPVADLISYGFDVTDREISWAGSDYYFDAAYMPDTDDEGMLTADPGGETHKIKAGDRNPILFVVNGEMCLDAEDLAASFGYSIYDEDNDIMNIYVTEAGYDKNEEGYRNITVDAADKEGVIRSLQGTHANQSRGHDFTEVFPELGVDVIRTHDYAGLDMSDLYIPMIKGDADGWDPEMYDPEDWNNYDFSKADEVIDNILSTGSEVFFRYGDGHYPDIVPTDVSKWETYLNTYVEIAEHIIRYYNLGEQNDGKYQDVINWFEFWNEPDLTAFWDGNADQFYQFYDTVALAVKELDPEIRFGGPVLTTLNDYTGYMDSFMKHVADHHIPMDFYSYHYYPTVNGDPYEYTRLAYNLSAALSKYGFDDLPLTLTEWDTKIYLFPGANIQYEDHQEAAYVASAMIYMQDSNLVNADLYSFHPLLKTDDSDNIVSLSKKGYAFRALNYLNETPERLCTSGGDKNGFAVLAGRNEEKINILISNYQIPTAEMFPNNTTVAGIVGELVVNNDFAHPEGVATWTLPPARVLTYHNAEGYHLTVKNLPEGKDTVTVEVYRIDQDHDFEQIAMEEAAVNEDGSITISRELHNDSVDLITIY